MVIVVDKRKRYYGIISHAYARILLSSRQAVIHKRYPFTIRLKNDNAVLKNEAYTVKLDPSLKTTGVAIDNKNLNEKGLSNE